MSPLPTWLRTHLEDTTGLDYTNARGRYATPTRCRHCSAPILTGQCGVPGWPVRVDPTPLTAQQEVACLLTRRTTYTLTEQGRRIEISQPRTKWDITGHPPDRATVVPDHLCGARFPDPPPAPKPAPTYLDDPDAPPPF